MRTLDFLKNTFGLHGKSIGWAIVEEITSETVELKPGLYIKGSRTYVDLYARRFYSIVKLGSFERKVFPARKVRAGDGMAVLESKEYPSKYVVLPKTFINDIFGTSIYGEWMEKRLLL